MSNLWDETFFGCVDVRKLKQKAYQLKNELDSTVGFLSWFKKSKIKSKLIHILDEIDYQEGRLQFANRLYSKSSARVLIHGCAKNDSCECGCWAIKRREFFKL